jgi:NAD(P)-dependent dehydrogenase (short-subunit alcohol dehydrogenase family)
MELGLKGKTAIVTGGSSNIGRAIVLGLAKEGANVVITYRDEKQARKTAEDANALGGGRALPVQTQVVDRASVESMVKQTLDAFGRIDILVNNVGASTDGPRVVEKPYDQIEHEVNVNYWSVIHCCKAVAPAMIERKWGRIVNLGSGVALVGRAGDSIYAASKAAVIGFTKSLSRELGQYNITVNCVVPGWTMPEDPGDVGQGSFWHGKSKEVFSPEYIEKQVRVQPIRRVGTPRDVSDMVAFLASDRASYVTGQTVCVDGGAVIT